MSTNFFASNFLIENRASLHYRTFLSSVYAINELNDHTFSFEAIMEMPYPLFHDYVQYQLNEKKKEVQKRKQELEKMSKK